MATRYIYEVFRSTPKELVFAQALFGFELASADPRVVAINFVGEEDDHTSMTDYADHMRIVGFLRTLIPRFVSACMPASLRRGSCRRRAYAATSGSPSSRPRPIASVMAST